MAKSELLIKTLFSIRNKYEKKFTDQKVDCLQSIIINKLRSKNAVLLYNDVLLFLIAFPDNKNIYRLAQEKINELEKHIKGNGSLQYSLYNSGIRNSSLCAAFSFEIVKWLSSNFTANIRLNSFEAPDEQIRSILTAVMPKIETEKMQESKTAWKEWILRGLQKEQELLDGFIAIFDNSDLRPEVKDELWNTIGINTEIDCFLEPFLSEKFATPFYHRSLRKSSSSNNSFIPKRVLLEAREAKQIIDLSRMVLIGQLREIDPISFTYPNGVSYYSLERGYGIALFSMMPERQVPNDSYMGYTVFKNGLPIAYAGSWIMFDSSRIGLNVFPAYRGGESQYIFQLVLQVHAAVYKLKRFTVDTYQIGKDNYDGIRSGAFWVYHHAGFRPINKEQKELAAAEAGKIKNTPGYRSPLSVLKKFAESRMELRLNKSAFNFDAVDLSDIYAAILKKQFSNDRYLAKKGAVKKLAGLLQIKNNSPAMNYILENWALVLLYKEKELRKNNELKKELKRLFLLKATGKEEVYIANMQKAKEFKKILELIWKELI